MRQQVKSALVDLVVNQVRKSEPWAQALGRPGAEGVLRKLADTAVASVWKEESLNVDVLDRLNRAARSVERDAKHDYVSAAESGQERAASALLAERLQRPDDAKACRARCSSACERLGSGLRHASEYSGSWGSYLVRQALSMLPSPKPLLDAGRNLMGFTAGSIYAPFMTGEKLDREEPGWAASYPRKRISPEDVTSFFGDLITNKVSRPNLALFAGVRQAIRNSPTCAAAAVDQAYWAIEKVKESPAKWKAISVILLDLPPATLAHVYLFDDQLASLSAGASGAMKDFAALYQTRSFLSPFRRRLLDEMPAGAEQK
jgi:hypothetical protein